MSDVSMAHQLILARGIFMTDNENIFSDITGWYEEYLVLANGAAKQTLMLESAKISGLNKVPLSNIYEYAELILHLDETKKAVFALMQWRVDNREALENVTITIEHPSFPQNEMALLFSFSGWYELKRMIPQGRATFPEFGEQIAYRVQLGEFPNVRSIETYEFLKREREIEFDLPPPNEIN